MTGSAIMNSRGDMPEDPDTDICLENCVHTDTVERLRNRITRQDMLENLSELFKILGDVTRVKILDALAHEELCVCDLASLLDMTSSAVSHQLRILRTAKLVKNRKSGKNVFYRLDDAHVLGLMDVGLQHVQE